MQAISLLLVWCAWGCDARTVGGDAFAHRNKEPTPLRALSQSLLATSPIISKKHGLSATRRSPVHMESVKSLRNRVKGIKTTAKITSSMQMVAAAKVNQAAEVNQDFRPNMLGLQKAVEFMNTKLEDDSADTQPLAAGRPVKKILLIVTTGDRGLCGGFNSKIIRKTEQLLAKYKKQDLEVETILVGVKATKYFVKRQEKLGFKVRSTFPLGKPAQQDGQYIAEELAKELVEGYVGGEYDRVELLYTRFLSMATCEPYLKPILPYSALGEEEVETDDDEDDPTMELEEPELPEEQRMNEYQLELDQSPEFLLEYVGNLMLANFFVGSWTESYASELACRVIAMQAATDNAKGLAKRLNGIMNRKRQMIITQQMCEIAAGSEAMKDVD